MPRCLNTYAMLKLAVTSIVDRLPIVINDEISDIDLVFCEGCDGLEHFLFCKSLSESVPGTYSPISTEFKQHSFPRGLTIRQSIIPILSPDFCPFISFVQSIDLLLLLSTDSLCCRDDTPSMIHDGCISRLEIIA